MTDAQQGAGAAEQAVYSPLGAVRLRHRRARHLEPLSCGAARHRAWSISTIATSKRAISISASAPATSSTTPPGP